MATKKASTKKSETVKLSPRAELEAKIRENVKQYNESKEFNEGKRMQKLDEKLRELLADYTKEAENDCFNELLKAADPMRAAAEKMQFETLTVADPKKDGVTQDREVKTASRTIDPLRLHKKSKDTGKGGIGANKLWFGRVDSLNVVMTVATAIKLGKDPATVKAAHARCDEAKDFANACDGNPVDDNLLLQDVQDTLDAMIGKGFTATPADVAFLRAAHEKAGRDATSLVASTPKTIRELMLGVCHNAITGEGYTLIYKTAKKQG